MDINIPTDAPRPITKPLQMELGQIRRSGPLLHLYDIFTICRRENRENPFDMTDHSPGRWLSTPETKALIENLQLLAAKNNNDDMFPETPDGSRMVHPAIALAYAEYLNPDVHAWLQRELAEEASRDPELTYEGHTIGCRGDMLNLTSMWIARGRPDNRMPARWLRQVETQRLLAEFDREKSTVLNKHSTLETSEGNSSKAGTWAHKDIALAYAAYLSPSFHLWVLRVALKAIETGQGPTEGRARPMGVIYANELAKLQASLDAQIRSNEGLHRRLNRLQTNGDLSVERIVERIDESDERDDRNMVDVMFLVSSMKEILFGKRMEFTESSRNIINQVVAEKYHGICPCCDKTPVLSADGQVIGGAEYDHHLGNRFNKPEFGWLICKSCHDQFTFGGHSARVQPRDKILAFHDHVKALKRYLRIQRKHAA